jgi:EAL domain-containing protein (putative c-di-GMP-specific phosphodiesterase class I)
MNIKTIAKHVENVFTLNQLKEIGIDYAQGFFLDKPGKLSERVDEIKRSTKNSLSGTDQLRFHLKIFTVHKFS